MANIIEVILKANDQTGSTFSKLNSSFQSLTGVSLTAAGGIALAAKAIQAGIQYTKEAIESNDKYVSSIVDMARFTGDQTDAMSRLVQVADDVFLSQEALNNAMSIGAKKGLDMSVEGIKKLADEYNALATPQERAKLLNDNFGRSGLAMGKLLEQGSAGITKNMQAVEKNLVVTKKSVQIAYDYKRSVDAATDAQDAFAYSVAQGTMPALTKLNTQWASTVNAINESEAATKALAAGSWMLEGALAGLQVIFAGYTKNEIDSGKQAEIAADRFDKMSSAIIGVTEAQKENKESADALTASFKPLTNEIIFNTLAASLDATGQLTLARHLGLIDEAAYNAGITMAGLTAQFDLNANGLIDPIEQTDAYWQAIGRVTATAGTYYWNYVVTGSPQMAPASIADAMKTSTVPSSVPVISNPSVYKPPPSQATAYTHRASGGDVYAGQSYWVGERGPEPFIPKTDGTIISNKNAMGGMNDSQFKALLEASKPNYDMMANAFANALSRVGR